MSLVVLCTVAAPQVASSQVLQVEFPKTQVIRCIVLLGPVSYQSAAAAATPYYCNSVWNLGEPYRKERQPEKTRNSVTRQQHRQLLQ